LISRQTFLGAFVWSRKAPITFVMSDTPSAYRHVSARLPLGRVPRNLILGNFMRDRRENTKSLLIDKYFGTLHEDLYKSYCCRWH